MAAAQQDAVHLAITGMHCDGCAGAVARVLNRVPGVTDVSVDLATAAATVQGTAQVAALVGAIQAAGYGASAGSPA